MVPIKSAKLYIMYNKGHTLHIHFYLQSICSTDNSEGTVVHNPAVEGVGTTDNVAVVDPD